MSYHATKSGCDASRYSRGLLKVSCHVILLVLKVFCFGRQVRVTARCLFIHSMHARLDRVRCDHGTYLSSPHTALPRTALRRCSYRESAELVFLAPESNPRYLR